MKAIVGRCHRGHEVCIHGVNDDGLGRTHSAELLLVVVKVGYLQEPAAIRIVLALHRPIGVAFEPVFDAAIDGLGVVRRQVQMPTVAVLAIGVLEGLRADEFGRVVSGKVRRDHVAVGGLPNEALLRGDANTGLGRRIIEPHVAAV